MRFFREKIPGDRFVPVAVPGRKPPDDLAEIFTHVDGVKSIAEICRTSGHLEFEVTRAVFQLVSGTIGERLGRRRVVRTAYIVYAMVSVAAALSPSIGAFLGRRSSQP